MSGDLLDAQGCADYLGIPLQAVYRLVQRKAIPHVRLPALFEGGEPHILRFPVRELESWIFKNVRKPKPSTRAQPVSA